MRGRHPLAALALLALAACATPEPDYYRLAVPAGAEARLAPMTVEVRRVGLAGYLDRPEVVVGGADGRVTPLGAARWAGPLDEEVARALAAALSQRLPAATVVAEGGAVRADGDLLVELDLRRFEPTAAGTAELEALVAVRRPGGEPGAIRRVQATVPVTGQGTAAQVAAMGAALAKLADEAAALLAAAPRRPGA